MSTSDLQTLIEELEPTVREASSMLGCAKKELQRRPKKERLPITEN